MKFGLRHIRYFIAVAEDEHFRRAAQRLGVAQPALSRAIQHLEAELGFDLFDRSNRQVHLTRAGREFLQSTRQIVSSVEHAVENAQLVANGQIGTLRIGYTDIAIAGKLPMLLQAFQQTDPKITLKPHHDVTSLQLEKLETGLLDVGFVTGPVSLRGFDQVPIQEDRFVCVVYKNHRFAQKKQIALADLADENFVHGPNQDWQYFYSLLLPMCRKVGFMPRIVQEAYNSAGILGLVASGMGITILTESDHLMLAGGLRQIEIVDVTEQLSTVAVWRTDMVSGAVNRFSSFLRDRDVRKAGPISQIRS